MGLTVISILTNAAPTRRLLPPNFPARRFGPPLQLRFVWCKRSGAGLAIGVTEEIPNNPAKTTPLAPNPKRVLISAPIKQGCPPTACTGRKRTQ